MNLVTDALIGGSRRGTQTPLVDRRTAAGPPSEREFRERRGKMPRGILSGATGFEEGYPGIRRDYIGSKYFVKYNN